MGKAKTAVRAVLLDMDGTLWHNPVNWMALREELGLGVDHLPISYHLARLPPADRAAGERRLREAEAQGVSQGRPVPRARELVEFLVARGVKCALVTNNSRESVDGVLARCPLPLDAVFSREDIPLKPDPEAFLLPLRKLGVGPEEACVIGDSHLDLLAAHRAGIGRVILVAPQGWMRALFPPGARFQEVRDLWEAREVLAELLTGA
ncbi:MAG TPA: HAD family phosphatase [Candidatus Acetothermia bacterium]|nr:HAD family phosphatase [Candidatus Acetothermia bacterium]